ncbi:MAG: PilT/PilU family type 4a pilus ATPase [Cellulosilyticum sp.]|nr:PilT/PilU family type 4a pilus ATPase [Cellulosilyticum sp.]
MQIEAMLKDAVDKGASDIFIVAGRALSVKVNGSIEMMTENRLSAANTEILVKDIYALAHRKENDFDKDGDDDFSFSIGSLGRFRVNAYKQRGSYAAVIRVVNFAMPDPKKLNIPDTIINLFSEKQGLILITGPAGSGKSTTLACMIDKMNENRNAHIITLEDPIEYIHSHKKSIVSQREIPTDTMDYVSGLRAALRQAPDAILLGEMRDLDTISIAMTAAETGQLIFSTLHTLGAAHSIDRIIDVFPSNQQHQIRVQLAMVLKAVISQQLVPGIDGTLIPAFEIMTVTPAIRNLIRDAKIHQIEAMMQASRNEGMKTMDMSLLELYQQGRIDDKQALIYAINKDAMLQKIKR